MNKYGSLRGMKKKYQYDYDYFQVALDGQEKRALEKLAEKQGVTMSRWFKNTLRRTAKRRGCWE